MTDDTYNGWTNRESWALHLHLSNDEGLWEMSREAVRDKEGVRAGDALKDWYGELVDEFADAEGVKLMQRDVGSLWRVDWEEVAAALTEE